MMVAVGVAVVQLVVVGVVVVAVVVVVVLVAKPKGAGTVGSVATVTGIGPAPAIVLVRSAASDVRTGKKQNLAVHFEMTLPQKMTKGQYCCDVLLLQEQVAATPSATCLVAIAGTIMGSYCYMFLGVQAQTAALDGRLNPKNC